MTNTPTPPQAERLSERIARNCSNPTCDCRWIQREVAALESRAAQADEVFAATFAAQANLTADRDAWKARAEKAEALANRLGAQPATASMQRDELQHTITKAANSAGLNAREVEWLDLQGCLRAVDELSGCVTAFRERAEKAEAELSEALSDLGKSMKRAAGYQVKLSEVEEHLAASRARVAELEQCLRQTGPIAFAELQAREAKMAASAADAAKVLRGALSAGGARTAAGGFIVGMASLVDVENALGCLDTALSDTPAAPHTVPGECNRCGALKSSHRGVELLCPFVSTYREEPTSFPERPTAEKVAADRCDPGCEYREGPGDLPLACPACATRTDDGRDKAIKGLSEQVLELKRELAARVNLPAQSEELREVLTDIAGHGERFFDLVDRALRLVPVAHDDAQGGRPVETEPRR